MRYKRILILLCLCFLVVLGFDYLTLGNKYRVVFKNKDIFIGEMRKKSFVMDKETTRCGPFGEKIKVDVNVYEFKNKKQLERKIDELKVECRKDKNKKNKHYFCKDNIIALYIGNNKTALYYLENFLGKQAMGEAYKSLDDNELTDIYIKALNSIVVGNLCAGAPFYAIDMESCEFANINLYNKHKILNHLNKQGKLLFNASFETLKKFKMISKRCNNVRLCGVIVSIDRVIFVSDKKIIVYGNQFAGGLAAKGFRCELLFKDGKWKVVDSHMTWIS